RAVGITSSCLRSSGWWGHSADWKSAFLAFGSGWPAPTGEHRRRPTFGIQCPERRISNQCRLKSAFPAFGSGRPAPTGECWRRPTFGNQRPERRISHQRRLEVGLPGLWQRSACADR
ncbi:MAG: hypothetical protein N3B68_00555, partial [Anaerolineae bacterium]|nr:hypothetical protein [Anaerolineae bacterium]